MPLSATLSLLPANETVLMPAGKYKQVCINKVLSITIIEIIINNIKYNNNRINKNIKF